MPASAELLWETPSPRCVVLTLNRPQRGNALCVSLVEALDQALERAELERPRLLILRGAGPHFCTGFDLSDLQAETDDSLLARFTRVELVLQRLHHAPYSTLALAHGRTMGAGADLFCACSDRWTLGEAIFAFPGASFGLVLGTRRLACAVGSRQAQAWVESGESFNAAQALQSGLATSQVQPGALDGAIAQLLARVSRLDETTQGAVRQAAHALPGGSAEAAAADDLSRLVRSAALPGLKERIQRYRAAQQRS